MILMIFWFLFLTILDNQGWEKHGFFLTSPVGFFGLYCFLGGFIGFF
jgi:hypothetical protein